MLDITFTGAIFAGLLSFLSPCILPMVPFYLCYLAGISMNELRDSKDIPSSTHHKLILASIFFALGTTTIFVLLGLGASFLGQLLRVWKQELSYMAAAFLFAFGLHFLGIIRVGLFYRETKITSKASSSTWIGSYIMGLAFGFGWTPCVGPALASILMIAGGMGDALHGTLLLLVYGLSMTLPFVFAAIFAKPFLRWMQRNNHYIKYVEKIMGLMLIIFALLIATNSVNYIANIMIKYMPWFSSIG
ncbi:cytochrome c biogenesis protein CcdA [Amylibacter sp.]|jgi:cytochrome c-type biogenesis protein|nr:cytochrome c biogenesis protein CcdA [Amylibacter sp.]MDB9729636.1 cytochrome c biogenesis protein CcdA [Amylibacter sp.]MDB9763267.1 cytochrome c biogenesis protein CcdA [Amylibacter sp.]MDB9852807.1 cytochrome c biogenesis protein CcdA [Amylibacter sp.]MDB9878126.1 cytochrome c biogenesis protein CcdA [Amylibacter sp.]